ncbi:unnamed protein product [Rotaria sp. Silwood2]|nr:unnamed protein product [Rotaria sp. Silwood2]CAF3315415.1 unnamed protein product [Rotaria sp. Silwood2]CAF3854509.1 unnamed protein product [Rotaria sp. Silwood2]CAF4175241.1 unnamed protein product [Rotaria sp. Silwood2]
MAILSKIVPIGWLAHIGACFYLVRPLRTFSYRTFLTIIPCGILTFVGCSNLPLLHMSSMMIIVFYWIMTIRLFHLIVLSSEQTLSLRSFIGKIFWFFIPVIECQSNYPVMFDILLAIVKLMLNNWIFQWFINCGPSDSYAKMAMFYVFLCTGTYVVDAQIALVRLITRNKYTLESFNNVPILSRSIREFWGSRYNRVVGSVLRESIFEPLRRSFSFSPPSAAIASFVVSGLLHAHVSIAIFGVSSPLPAFTFFLLQGIACCAEAYCPIVLPKPIGIAVTHMFLLLTAPLYVGLFTRAAPNFFVLNAPSLLNAKWLPQLPVPKFCPK